MKMYIKIYKNVYKNIKYEKCGHLDRRFKERTNFVMEQLLLKRIM